MPLHSIRLSYTASRYSTAPSDGQPTLLKGAVVSLHGDAVVCHRSWMDQLIEEAAIPSITGKVVSLSLHKCKVTTADLERLADAVCERAAEMDDVPFASLDHLDLSWNHLTDDCVKSLSLLVMSMPKLQRLQLQHNYFSPAGIEEVCCALESHQRITDLYPGADLLATPAFKHMESTVMARNRSRLAREREEMREQELDRIKTTQLLRNRWLAHLKQQRVDLEDYEQQRRREIMLLEQDNRRLKQKGHIKVVLEEKHRIHHEEVVMLQVLREAQWAVEEAEVGGRRVIEQEQDFTRVQMLKAERLTQERVLLHSEQVHQQRALQRFYYEFRERILQQEQVKRDEYQNQCREQARAKLVRRLMLEERGERDVVTKQQMEHWRVLLRLAKATHQEIRTAKLLQERRRGVEGEEYKARMEVWSAYQRAFKEIAEQARVSRHRARDATFVADQGLNGGFRVLERKEAYERLEVIDEEAAEHQLLCIGYLIEVPGTRSAEQVEAARMLRVQQAEEFTDRARERGLRQMEDLSVMQFEERFLNKAPGGSAPPPLNSN